MKSALVFAVAAASAEAALGFAPVAPAAPRSGVLALRAQVFLFPLLLGMSCAAPWHSTSSDGTRGNPQEPQVSRRGMLATFGAGEDVGAPPSLCI
jgi:hypothetical protein